MYKFEALEKWLADWRQGRINYTDKLKEAYSTWDKAHGEAFNNRRDPSIRRQIEVNDWSPTKGRYTKTVTAVVVIIDGVEFLAHGYQQAGQKAYFQHLGIGEVSQVDEQLVKYYSRDERIARIDKDVDYKRKNIIAKVGKICTADIKEVMEVHGDGLFIRGANGRVAHMWAVFAGGYNIQCLHIRVLVKEAAWLEATKPETKAETESKPVETDVNYSTMNVEELEALATQRGVSYKHYDNANIHRMRLIMALKRGV